MTFGGQPRQAAAPGWYHDPAGSGGLRYFDGWQWTQHVAPAPSAAAAAPWNQPAYPVASVPFGSDPHDPMHWMLPTGRTPQSIAAGYLGLFGLVIFPLAPFAIGFGIWALVRSKQTGKHGRGRAVFGIIAGFVSGALWLCLILSARLS